MIRTPIDLPLNANTDDSLSGLSTPIASRWGNIASSFNIFDPRSSAKEIKLERHPIPMRPRKKMRVGLFHPETCPLDKVTAVSTINYSNLFLQGNKTFYNPYMPKSVYKLPPIRVRASYKTVLGRARSVDTSIDIGTAPIFNVAYRHVLDAVGLIFTSKPSVRKEFIDDIKATNVRRSTRVFIDNPKNVACLQSMSNVDAVMAKLKAMGEGNLNYYIKWCEDILFGYHFIITARTVPERTMACINFLKYRLGDIPLISEELVLVMAFFKDYLWDDNGSMEDFDDDIKDHAKQQSLEGTEDAVKTMRWLLDNYETLKDRKIIKKLQKVLGFIVAIATCKEQKIELDFNLINMFYGTVPNKIWGPDFIFSLLDLAVYVMERGVQCFKLKSIQPIFHDGGAYDDWFTDSKKLINMSEYLNNPGPHGLSVPCYLADLDKLIEQGNSMCKYIDSWCQKTVKSMLMTLTKLKHDHIGYDAALANRPSPMPVMVSGGSGVAKSSFVHVLYIVFGIHLNLPIDDAFKYTRNSVDKFWVNFRTYKWCLIFDDVAYMRPSGGEADPSVMEILQIINNITFVPPQASLEDKGKTPCWAQLAIFTTNTPHLNAHEYFACPLAVLRRFPIIVDLRIKPEYAKSGSECQFADGAKLPEVGEGDLPDYWNIRIFKPIPIGNGSQPDVGLFGNTNDPRMHQRAGFEFVKEFTSIYKFVSWFLKKVDEHNYVQDKYMSFTQSIKGITLCPGCHAPVKHCVCEDKEEEPALSSQNENVIEPVMPIKEPVMTADVRKEIVISTLKTMHERLDEGKQPNIEHSFIKAASRWVSMGLVKLAKRYPRLTGVVLYYSTNYLAKNMFCNITPIEQRMVADLIGDIALKKIGVSAVFMHRLKLLGTFLASAASFSAGYFIMNQLIGYALPQPKLVTFGIPKVNDAPEPVDSKAPAGAQVALAEIAMAKPKPRVIERCDAWPRETYQLSKYELSPMITSWKSFSEDEIVERLFCNMKRISIHNKDGDRPGFQAMRYQNILGVCDHIYLINHHAIDNFPVKCRVYDTKDTSISTNKEIIITAQQYYRITDDCALLFLPNFPPVKNITRLFSIRQEGLFDGDMLTLSKECERSVQTIRAMRACPVFVNGAPNRVVYQGYPDIQTKIGECGSPVVRFTNMGPIIVGIHALGDNDPTDTPRSGTEIITQDIILDNITKIHPGKLCNQGEIRLSRIDAKIETCPINHKSPVHYIEKGFCKIVTGIVARPPKYDSKVELSVLHGALVERNLLCEKVKPSKLKDYHPWYIGFKMRTETALYFDVATMSEASKCFVADILKQLDDPSAIAEIYDIDTGINGYDGMAHVNALNWNTSMGFPFNKGKKHYRIETEKDRFTFTQEIMDEIALILETYSDGTTYRPIFKASPKDEVISKSKDEIGKIRLFFGSQGPWTVATRCIFLWLCRVVQNNPYVFECAAAMNTECDEWEVAFQYLTQHGVDRIIAGDYAGFDTYTDTVVMWYAFKTIIDVAIALGASETHVQMMWCAASDTTYSLTEFWGMICEFIGVTPSGFSLTLLLNCFKGSLYMRCVYLLLNPNKECHTFRDNVSLLNLGDDNISNVSPNCNWFNHTAIAEVFASVGITYTMAEKDQASVPYVSIYDATFVKRQWRYDAEFQCHVCPIAEESIMKSLHWRKDSTHVTPQAHAKDAIMGALRQYAWYGRDKYEWAVATFTDIIRVCKLEHYVSADQFKKYDDYIKIWYKNNKWVNYDHPWLTNRGVLDNVSRKRTEMSDLDIVTADTTVTLPLSRQSMDVYFIPPECSSESLLRDPMGWIGNNGIGGRVSNITDTPNIKRCTESKEVKQVTFEDVNKETSLLAYQRNYMLQRFKAILDVITDDQVESLMKAMDDSAFNKVLSLYPQSEEVHEEVDASTDQVTTIEFMDAVKGSILSLPNKDNVKYDHPDEMITLDKWFSRPLLIDTFTWNTADSAYASKEINPWYLFFNDARNKKKLDNYAFMRCKLKIKIVVNGTPFLYGAYMVSYTPLQQSNLTPNTIFGNPIPSGGAVQQRIIQSQLPYIWVTPHDSSGGELELPFIYNRKYLTISNMVSDEFKKFGVLKYQAFTNLQLATGTTSDGVTVNTFAWAENVELFGTTAALSFQSETKMKRKKDEYGQGPISGPASAVAALASWFVNTPVIGRYATATQMGAKAIAAGAAALGFTNVPVIDDIRAVRPLGAPTLATSEIGFQLDKLTFDPKNELTIDNGVLGGVSCDEMNIHHLVTRESYLGQFTWAQTAVEGAVLANIPINPGYFAVSDTTTYSTAEMIFSTPLAYFSQIFQYWRGDIIVRFKVIASKYHKGRMRLIFDPTGNAANNSVTNDIKNVVLSEVMDLSVANDVSVRIPYLQCMEWLKVAYFENANSSKITLGSSGTATYVQGMTNGTLVVRVQNELSAPSVTATATVLVFVKAADNFELAGPGTQWSYSDALSPLEPQSESVLEKVDIQFTDNTYTNPGRYLMHFGEGYTTLRQIVRRYTRDTEDRVALTAGRNDFRKIMPRIPMPYGFDTNGYQTALKQLSAGSANFNYNFLSVLTYIQGCFLGYRGSVNWIFRPEVVVNGISTYKPSITATRSPYRFSVPSVSVTTGVYTANEWNYITQDSLPGLTAGAAITAPDVQPYLSISAPNYSRFTFQGTNYTAICALGDTDDNGSDLVRVHSIVDLTGMTITNASLRLESFSAAGTDYNVIHFLHCPVMYKYTTKPVPS